MICRQCKSKIEKISEYIIRIGLCDKCNKNRIWMKGERRAFDDTDPFYFEIKGPNVYLEDSLNKIIKEKKDEKAEFPDVVSLSGDVGTVLSNYFKVTTESEKIFIFPEKIEHLILYGKSTLKNSNNVVIPSDKLISVPLCEIKRIDYLKTYSDYKYTYEFIKGYKGLTYEKGSLYGADAYKFEIGELNKVEVINPYWGHYHEAYFHFCPRMEQVLGFRDYINIKEKRIKGYPYCKLFEIEASGHVIFRGENNGVANQIKIIREVSPKEIIEYFNAHKEYLQTYNITDEQWEEYQNEFK